MAIHGYMKLEGEKQKLISAGCSTKESIGNKFQAAHVDEIMVLACTHELANLENLDKPSHSPIVITKYVDKSSPLLARALAQREEIAATIDFYRVAGEAGLVKFYSVSTNGGIISGLTLDLPHVLEEPDAEPQEHLALRYQDITWTNHLTSTSGQTFWDEKP